MDTFLLILGFVLVILIMAFVVNPPEAWIKKVMYRDSTPKKNRDK